MRAAKIDNAQAEIVKKLRDAGVQVQSLAEVGKGCPDLLCGWRGANFLFEVKTGDRECDRKLTLMEQEWHTRWSGQVNIVSNFDEAMAVILDYEGVL